MLEKQTVTVECTEVARYSKISSIRTGKLRTSLSIYFGFDLVPESIRACLAYEDN